MNIKQAKAQFTELTGRDTANKASVEREFKLLGLGEKLADIKALGLNASHTEYWTKVVDALWDYAEITFGIGGTK